MALKDLFKDQAYQYLASTALAQLTGNIESVGYIKAYIKNKKRFIPLVDYSKPENFARFGSAEKYYYDSINRVYTTYPYDGSLKEKIYWELSSSHLDLYLLDNGYPRTTGYGVFSTSSLSATATSTDFEVWGSYGAAGTSSYEYVFVNGGPHAGEGVHTYIDPDTGEAHYKQKANIWDKSKNRECNLKIGGTDGNTVEFWLKKASFNNTASYKEVIFDIHTTSSISSSADYGRLRIEISGTGEGTSPFYITYMSGTSGFANQVIGSSITTGSVADNRWHHYAFRFKNTDPVGTVVSASAEVSFAGGTCDPDQSITIVSSDGTSKTYVGKNAETLASNQFNRNPVPNVQAVAESLKDCINNGSGHSGKIIATIDDVDDKIVNLIQVVAGTAGNNTITSDTGLKNATISGFSDGTGIASLVATDLFVDGVHNHYLTSAAGVNVDYVSGTIVGTIGALATHPSGTQTGGAGLTPQATKGWGKLSGSIDEFRFWKTWRNSEQIQTRWFDQVGGGTNTDDANTHLGVYYKFNEGITLTSSIDSIVLDYSGRVSNGSWTGYSSLFSRNTGSAIDDANALMTNFSGSEFKDPIIYRDNPQVRSFLLDKRSDGRFYDYTNPSNIYYSMPTWILEEHDAINPDSEGIIENSLWNLTQIISSFFDDLASKIQSLPKLVQTDYITGTLHPIPFMDRILESKNFISPELFSALDALESFENRDSNTIYTSKIPDIKNLILKNIYNNLTYINKSKGTEKSFRNLVRCFGIDDKIYKFNVYGNNVDYILRNNYRSIAEPYKFIDFNVVANADATIYQYSSSLNTNSTVTYLSASEDYSVSTSQERSLSFTVQSNITFPRKYNAYADYNLINDKNSQAQNYYSLAQTASLFGLHTAITDAPGAVQWASNDYANFVVKAVRPIQFTNKSRFVLTGTAGGFIPHLTSSMIDEVYDEKNWSFFVSLYPTKYLNANLVAGTSGSLKGGYTVEFAGVQAILDQTVNEFSVTGTISEAQGIKFLASPKRIFVGAHYTDFTGAILQTTDVRFNNIRAWQNKLSTADLKNYSANPKNYGIENPSENSYLTNTTINHIFVPKQETLLLHWDFDNVTGSDASGEFIVEDLTSGSVNEAPRYGWLGNLKKQQYLGKGYGFVTSSTSVIAYDELITAKPNLPEVMGSDDMIKIMQNDDIYFTRDKRPIFFDLFVEKSPYQNISEDMMNFIATAADFNNIIGQGVDRYRHEYKTLNTLRQLFFENIEDTPNIDKYIEYFKWFDLAIDAMLQKIAPMSSGLDERPLRNIIESHILERSKYQSKFPSYEFKQSDPEANVFGINELTYNWKFGHSGSFHGTQDTNCLWWKKRAKRTNPTITSGDTDVDANRQSMLDVINTQVSASGPILSGSDGSYEGSTFALRNLTRPYKIRVLEAKGYHGGTNFSRNKNLDFSEPIFRQFTTVASGLQVNKSSIMSASSCLDNKALNDKPEVNFTIINVNDGAEEGASTSYVGDLIAPYNIVSSSVEETEFTGVNLVNIHNDTYGYDKDIPLQGPFTEKYVGGKPYRHTWNNFETSENTKENRAEGWRIDDSTTRIISNEPCRIDASTYDAKLPRSVFYREETAKRPVNIKNIQQKTGSDGYDYTVLGNYSQPYEVVMTNCRTLNNRFLAESDGDLGIVTTDNPYVSGVMEVGVPRRDLTGTNKNIIVNRFSSPGDPATMGQGMLDITAGEYSVYNALPWRNLNNRLSLDEFYRDHNKQFGYFSDAFYSGSWTAAIRSGLKSAGSYPATGQSGSVNELHYYEAPPTYLNATASFHKINRNGRPQPRLEGSYISIFPNSKYIDFETSNDQYLYKTTPAGLITGTSTSGYGLTFSAWIRLESSTACTVAGHGDPHSSYETGRWTVKVGSGGALRVVLYEDGETGTNFDTLSNAVTVGKWHHIAFTYNILEYANAATLRIFVDGIPAYKTSNVTAVWTTAPPLTNEDAPSGGGLGVGASYYNNTIPSAEVGANTFDGAIDEVSFWGKALTGKEVEELYDLAGGWYIAVPGPSSLYSHAAADDLVSWWRMGDADDDEVEAGTADGVIDVATNSNDNDLSIPSAAANPASSSINFLTGAQVYENTGRSEKRYDNWFVQHQIPQTDLQYAWITASVVSDYSGSALYGFEQPDFSNASLASTDLTFCSASDFVMYNKVPPGSSVYRWGRDKKAFVSIDREVAPVDFAGLTIIIRDPLTSSTNFLGNPSQRGTGDHSPVTSYINYPGLVGVYYDVATSPGVQSTLNALILNRQGPYGWPSWKQVRGEQHPIVRTHRKENRLSYLDVNTFFVDGELAQLSREEIASSIEPMITSKFHPMNHQVTVKTQIGVDIDKATKTAASINHSYLNRISYFTDHSADGYNLNEKILDPNRNSKTEQQTLDVIEYYIFTGDFTGVQELNPIQEFISYTSTETVFPKEQYTYLSKTRGRGDFICHFWRETHAEREIYSGVNSLGYTIPIQSMWDLDGRINITTTTPQTGGYQASGELLSNAAVYLDRVGNFLPSILYTQPTSSSNGAANSTAWDAGAQSGVDPFAPSYADYANEIRRIGKDYSILPEFRISEYIADYIDSGFDINTKNSNIYPTETFLTLTGSVLDNTDSSFYTVYNTSDFLKFFNIRNEKNDGTSISSVKMTCKALMKFLPYDGFYPAQRTAQMSQLFSSSYLMGGISSGSARAGITPFYAPGIMYNSIKAGMAVDFPVPSSSYDITQDPTGKTGRYYYNFHAGASYQTFVRIPFEAIIDPQSNIRQSFRPRPLAASAEFKWKDLQIDSDSKIGEDDDVSGYAVNNYTFAVTNNNKPDEYVLATNNFFAESINFFLPGGRMTSLVSLPSNHPNFGTTKVSVFKGGAQVIPTYKMRIYLSNDANFNLLSAFSEADFYNYSDSRAYGVPISTKRGYGAYIPPFSLGAGYQNSSGTGSIGYGWIDMEWTPENPNIPDEYTLENIMQHVTSSTYSISQLNSGDGVAMQLSASINVIKGKILSTEFDAITGEATKVSNAPEAGSALDVLLIEPKWECPQLQFKNVPRTSGNVDLERRGMWHQKGEIDESVGVYMSVMDTQDVDQVSVGSLARLMGFDQTNGMTPKRLGKVASTKEISEAVVAIPFRVIGNRKVTFKIERSAISQAELLLKGHLADKGALPENPTPDQSIVDMVRKMQSYVIPPHMDFVTYASKPPGKPWIEQINGGPFAMYIFEFTHKLTQQDLANVWQNLPPTSIGGAPYYHESDEVEISHQVFDSATLNLLAGEENPAGMSNAVAKQLQNELSQLFVKETRWMVFKVKKRAATNYYEKTSNLNDGGEYTFKFANQDTGFPKITYNWPYDYFSMIELVKLDAAFTMSPPGGIIPVFKNIVDSNPDDVSTDVYGDDAGVLPQE